MGKYNARAKGKIYVILGHSEPKKSLHCYVRQDKDLLKTKTISYANRSFDEVYNEIVNAAKNLKATYKAEYIHKTKEQLTGDRPGLKHRNPAQEGQQVIQENPLVAKFGNEMLFKAMIKHAIKSHGVEKTIEVLKSGLSIAQEAQKETAKRTAAISSANIEIAKIIIQTRNQGIDMPSPSKEIDAAIQYVMDEANKPKPSKKVNSGVRYRLGEEEWNGCGHAPASFSAYLNKNENHSLDDLIVR